MAITLVQSAFGVITLSKYAAALQISLSGVVAGDWLIVAAAQASTSSPTSVSDSAGSVWSMDVAENGYTIWSAQAAASGAITVTVAFPAPSTGGQYTVPAVLMEFSGLGGRDTTGTGSTPVSVSTSAPNEVVVFLDTNASDAQGNVYQSGANTSVPLSVGYAVEATSGTHAFGTTGYTGAAAAYKPSSTPLPITGAVTGVGAVTGTVTVEEPITGTVPGVGLVTGTVEVTVAPSGDVIGVGAVTGDVVLYSSYVTNPIPGIGAVTGTVTVGEPASGVIVGIGALVGTVTQGELTSGAIPAVAAVTGTVAMGHPVSGVVAGIGSVVATLGETANPSEPALYIFDSAEKLQAVLSPSDGSTPTTTGPCPFYNAVQTVQLFNADNASAGQVQDQLVFDTPADHPDSAYVVEGALVAFLDASGQYVLYEVTLTDEYDSSDGLYKTATCTQAAQAELVDEWISSVALTNATPTTALTDVLNGTRWSVGNMTVTSSSETITIAQTNDLSALTQLVSTWGGELGFRVTISGNTITGRYVDWYEQRGAVTGKRYEMGKDIAAVTRTVDSTNVYTAVYGYGATNTSGGVTTQLTFSGVTWSTSSGDPADKPAGQLYVVDPTALATYGRAGGTRNRFTSYTDANQTDATALLQESWDYLQTVNSPTVTYQMTVADLSQISGYAHEAVNLGDTVNVLDNTMQPPIQEAMRVIQLDRDLINPLNTSVTLGTFRPTTVTTASQALNALERASSAASQAALAQSAADTAQSTANSAQVTADSALQPGSTINTSWLSGILSADQNSLESTGGYVTLDNRGLTILNASTYDQATQAMRLAGGIFGLSSEKDGAGDWVFTTFGTAAGFDATQINTGELDASKVTVNNLSASRIIGGTLTMGGPNNGIIVIQDAAGVQVLKVDKTGFYMASSPGYTDTFVYASSPQTSPATGISLPAGTTEISQPLYIGANGVGQIQANDALMIYSRLTSNSIIFDQSPSVTTDLRLRPSGDDESFVGVSGYAFRAVNAYALNNVSTGANKEAIRDHNTAESVKIIHDISLKDYVVKGHTRQRTGLIAEEAPVEVQSEDGLAIDLYAMIAHLTAAVQDLQAKVYQLEAK